MQTAFAQDTYGVGYSESLTDMSARLSSVLAVNGDSYSNNRHKRQWNDYSEACCTGSADRCRDLCALPGRNYENLRTRNRQWNRTDESGSMAELGSSDPVFWIKRKRQNRFSDLGLYQGISSSHCHWILWTGTLLPTGGGWQTAGLFPRNVFGGRGCIV